MGGNSGMRFKTPIVILTMIDKEARPYLIENRISAYIENVVRLK